MLDAVTTYRNFALRLVTDIRRGNLFAGFLGKLSERLPPDVRIADKAFGPEMIAAQLALFSRYWETACSDADLRGEVFVKIFTRAVLAAFDGPAETGNAVAYTDYLHCPGVEEPSMAAIAIARRFFQRLGGEETLLKDMRSKNAAPEFFRDTVYFFEGLKSEFMSRFEKQSGTAGWTQIPDNSNRTGKPPKS
jgi:hypothetical protein